MRRRHVLDRGSSSIEYAILFPIILMLVFGIVQTGLWFYARNVATAAAAAAARAAAVKTGTAGDGQAAAQSLLNGAAGILASTNVTVDRSATTVTVRVTGSSLSVIPAFGGVPIDEAASQPVERTT